MRLLAAAPSADVRLLDPSLPLPGVSEALSQRCGLSALRAAPGVRHALREGSDWDTSAQGLSCLAQGERPVDGTCAGWAGLHPCGGMPSAEFFSVCVTDTPAGGCTCTSFPCMHTPHVATSQPAGQPLRRWGQAHSAPQQAQRTRACPAHLALKGETGEGETGDCCAGPSSPSVRLMAAVLSSGAGMDPARGGCSEASAAASAPSSSSPVSSCSSPAPAEHAVDLAHAPQRGALRCAGVSASRVAQALSGGSELGLIGH